MERAVIITAAPSGRLKTTAREFLATFRTMLFAASSALLETSRVRVAAAQYEGFPGESGFPPRKRSVIQFDLVMTGLGRQARRCAHDHIGEAYQAA